MNIRTIGVIAAILVATLTIGSGSIKAVVWAGDQRYVMQDMLSEEFNKRRVQELIDRIDFLELKVKLGQSTKLDEAELASLKRKLTLLTKAS